MPSEYDAFPEEGLRVFDAAESMLEQQIPRVGTKLTMLYDYGDGWEIACTPESVLVDSDLPGRELPRVLEDAGNGIIEGCGGPAGLENLAAAFRQKKGHSIGSSAHGLAGINWTCLHSTGTT